MKSSTLIRPAWQLLHQSQSPLAQVPSTSVLVRQIRSKSTKTDPATNASSTSKSPRPNDIVPTIPKLNLPESPDKPNLDELTDEEIRKHLPRYPRSLQALHLQPLRRETEYGIPSCDLQMRAYNPRPIEFFSDFALRAAYYLGLPAFGPVPLPRIVERWTVPRSHFIFKKSQENFERITLRRLIQIRDGHPETVQIWLAFLQKHAYPGIGMKANMWEFGALDAAKEMDEAAKAAAEDIESSWVHFGQKKPLGTVKEVEEMLHRDRVKAAMGR